MKKNDYKLSGFMSAGELLDASSSQKAEWLLTALFYAGARVEVKDGQLWVSPSNIANHYAKEIKALKSDIVKALDHCPLCLAELNIAYLSKGKRFWCRNENCRYGGLEAGKGYKVKDLMPPDQTAADWYISQAVIAGKASGSPIEAFRAYLPFVDQCNSKPEDRKAARFKLAQALGIDDE